MQKLKCNICDTEIPIESISNGKHELPMPVQEHIKQQAHIRLRTEMKMRLQTVPEGNVSVIDYWKQFLNGY